ncbi:UDP-glucose 6-dehydrogenase TuaD [compost metagenome]
MQNADAVVIITEWDQFRALDLDRMKDALKAPVVIDLRNIYSAPEMKAKGFKYVSVGRH